MITRLGNEPCIHENCQLNNVDLGQYTEIGIHNVLENSKLDDFSYTGQFCIVQNAQIGKFVNIAAMVRIGPTDHPMGRPTLHHFTYRRRKYGFAETDDEMFFQWRQEQKVYIGHDTWIGHGAIVMPGVTIGNGAVVGSGAVVTKDVEPYAVVVGVTAKPIKKRFKDDIIEKLETIKWWDWPYEVIKERLNDFCLPINEFIEKYDKAGV
ncbi:phosphonate metabolim protein, transferase hexapeptide repeat family [Desulfosporosinus acidiphilus SJ4]|uniref:Phosphonate metabolim protein, transferase hexapeptide repeat family n=1 Tax=Desulfosporosinus acidiphilus (strain DSM 22704 / JCM 16185 / SJ4) TaxID=646529 RepID=I4D4J7_DESAJ|nr:DapH/DapD/GlmU-related protein [Desulfosporosinus acidiphilus]AFM40721.1 phosphonate metabolim protein, transferase hexapeptide repeat family [Desulfosporosinus acidiphilus SJ4]